MLMSTKKIESIIVRFLLSGASFSAPSREVNDTVDGEICQEQDDEQEAYANHEAVQIVNKAQIRVAGGEYGDGAADDHAEDAGSGNVAAHQQELDEEFSEFKDIQPGGNEVDGDGQHGAVVEVAVGLDNGHIIIFLDRSEQNEGGDARNDGEPLCRVGKPVLFEAEHGIGEHGHGAEHDGQPVCVIESVSSGQEEDLQDFKKDQQKKDYPDGQQLLAFVGVFVKPGEDPYISGNGRKGNDHGND